jgi:hypothetical protein
MLPFDNTWDSQQCCHLPTLGTLSNVAICQHFRFSNIATCQSAAMLQFVNTWGLAMLPFANSGGSDLLGPFVLKFISILIKMISPQTVFMFSLLLRTLTGLFPEGPEGKVR